MILTGLLKDVLGYKWDEIKSEGSVEGKKVDYILSVVGGDSIVIEAKRISSKLKKKQISQAVSYGVLSGIKWVLLTNVISWQLYRITVSDGERIRINKDLVFDVNIKNSLDEETINCLYSISRYGVERKEVLEQLWLKARLLAKESLVKAIFSEEIISGIRALLNKEDRILTDKEVHRALEGFCRYNQVKG